MKKIIKIILISIATILTIFFISGSIDYEKIKKGNDPILAIKVANDNNVEKWIGFGYTVIKCSPSEAEDYYLNNNPYKINLFPFAYACVQTFSIDVSDYSDYQIIDTDECDNKLEKIYQDRNYAYYLSCNKSEKILIKSDNGETKTLKEALSLNLVDIESLINKGLEIYQKRTIKQY